MSRVKSRVALGARMLDDHTPDWYLRVDIDRLNVNPTDGVLSQLFGTRTDGIIALKIRRDEDISAYGFSLQAPRKHEDHRVAENASLVSWWGYQIKMRRRMREYKRGSLETLDYEDLRWLLYEAGVLLDELMKQDPKDFSGREQRLVEFINRLPSRPPEMS